MNPKQKFRLATPELPLEIQCQVDELRKVFFHTQELMEKLDNSGKLMEKSVESSIEARKTGNYLLMLKGHDYRAHHQILKQYSQSIALAPQGTEELVLGYSNRSALLMHLQHYEEALVDIDRALQLTKDNTFKTKLQARQERCLELLNKQNLVKSTKYLTLAENKELEKIRSQVGNFNPSATVPCASDCVGLAYNDQLGKHLVATRDIKPGETVIVEEGYVCTPMLDKFVLVCSHCLQYAWNGIPCDKCAFAMYCSETCKKEAFKEYHDIECPILKYMWYTIFLNEKQGSDRIVSLRIFIKALREEGFENVIKEISEKTSEDNLDGLLSNGILRSDRFKSCYNLMPYLKDLETDYKTLEINTFQILYLLIERTDFLATLIDKNSMTDETAVNVAQPVFHDHDSTVVNPVILLKLKEALMKLISITATNQYAFETATWQCGYCNGVDEHRKKCKFPRGSVIVPTCSLINHSCTRNVSHVCVAKRKIVVYSICPIKKGEMLCSAYRSTSISDGDVKIREQKLKNFHCKCRACVDNISIEMVISDYDKDLRRIAAELKKKISKSVAKSYLENRLDNFEISKKMLQDVIKISQLVYKHLNYYKAFGHSLKCHGYIEKIMAKLYQDKVYMPNDC